MNSAWHVTKDDPEILILVPPLPKPWGYVGGMEVLVLIDKHKGNQGMLNTHAQPFKGRDT